MDRLKDKWRKQDQRKKRVRKKISGTADRPRLTVYRSHKNISVQAIDDAKGQTIVSASTLEKELSAAGRNLEGGKIVGQKIAERLKEKKITKVIFDRNGYLYHGVVKAVADGAREAGLDF